MLPYLVFLGFAVNLYGVIDYAKDMLRGKTKPNRVSFALWPRLLQPLRLWWM